VGVVQSVLHIYAYADNTTAPNGHSEEIQYSVDVAQTKYKHVKQAHKHHRTANQNSYVA
jgi:hypothetical protein